MRSKTITPSQSTKDTSIPRLEVYILNGGYGESIVVRLPNDVWGVVDCYTPSLYVPHSNPTLRFLEERQVQELAFLCLTHPHADHYRGMSQLLDRFPVHYFWQFGAVSPEGLLNLVSYLKQRALQQSDIKEQDNANDLQRTLGQVNARRKQGQLKVMFMSDIKPLYFLPAIESGPQKRASLSIYSIAPSSNHIANYTARLSACFTLDGRLKSSPPSLPHNEVSAALLIQYGKTRVVLGGDVEASNWRDTQEGLRKFQMPIAAHAVKVSHHGSPTGYTEDLWQELATDNEPIAVITPSRRHRLPRHEAIEHIQNHTQNLFTTCLEAVPFVTSSASSIWSNHAPQVRFLWECRMPSQQQTQSVQHGICALAFDDTGHGSPVECEGGAAPLNIMTVPVSQPQEKQAEPSSEAVSI